MHKWGLTTRHIVKWLKPADSRDADGPVSCLEEPAEPVTVRPSTPLCEPLPTVRLARADLTAVRQAFDYSGW